MNDICSYTIKLHGQVSESEINALSPFQMKVRQAEANGTLLILYADQSGLVGLIRHLHGLGFLILSFERIENKKESDHAAN